MCRAVLWRLVANLSASLVPFLAAAMSFTSIARAESAEASAPNAVPTPQSCHEQFLLGRKDNAQLALQRLRQCNAIYNASMNIEEFTFWYVTLPSKSAAQQNAWFGNIWRNNLRILTAAPIGVPKQEAIGVLDAGIERGLKRAKREDLAPKWLASHDPGIIADAASPDVPAQTRHEQAQQSNARTEQAAQAGQPGSNKVVAEAPRLDSVSRPATYRAVSRPRRIARGVQSRYAGRNSVPPARHDLPQGDPLIDELNRAQLQDGARYTSGRALYVAPQPQPYIASSAQPASSFAPIAVQQPAYPSSVQQQPSSAASASQQPGYAIAQPPASHASSAQPGAYLPLPLQIEANVRSMLQEFAINVDTIERTISRQLRGY